MDEEDDTDLASHKAIWQVSRPRGIYFSVRFSRNKFLERSREALVGPDTTKSPTQPKSEMRPGKRRVNIIVYKSRPYRTGRNAG